MASKNKPEITQEQAAEIAAQTNKPVRNRPMSVEKSNSASKNDISRIVANTIGWMKMQPPADDDECEERLYAFFDTCAARGEIPSVEKMALALGVTRQSLWNWEHGLKSATERRRQMIQRAKEALAAIDAELVYENKIQQVAYIFRAKNYFGMSDKTEVSIAPTDNLEPTTTAEELQARYAYNVPFEETEGE
ncbi:MAG: hypothetical protein IJW55_07495 [Clostridia bacterium]|nr:hypothetical protein [Clostridia bacterium]